MRLETKRIIIASLGGLFLLSLVFVQWMETARKAEEAGVPDRVRFEVASGTTFSGTNYDLVTAFDCLHDMHT